MRIIVAPDSFKGSLSAVSAADAIERGILEVFPDARVFKIPMADGGEGTLETLVKGTGGVLRDVTVTGPLGEPAAASYGILDNNTAVIEMALASGLTLVPPDRRNPMITTTYGTGELIKAALDAGCRKIVIGIGGSATNDGGMGMAQALGVSFKDAGGKELGFGGGELARLALIDTSRLDPRIRDCEITAACDVTNPLCGETGASFVYGPQKGATPEMVRILDSNLRHYAQALKEQLGIDIAQIPGSGAAGGLGAGLMAFCGARLKSGIDTLLDAVGFDNLLPDADLVITGEGRIDGQSVYGKVPVGVARRAKKYGVPVIAIGGAIGSDAGPVYDCGVDALLGITHEPMPLEEAMERAEELLCRAAAGAMRILAVGMETGRPGRRPE